MSNHQSTKRVFWKSGLFWAVLIAVAYFLLVRIEENAYNNFIKSEWPTHIIKYTTENSPLVGEYINTLTTDDKGQVWIGTDDALNVVAPDGSWTIYTGTRDGSWVTSTNDSTGVGIQSVAIDKLERIWVGTFDGLYVLNPNGQWTTYDERSKTVYEHYTSSAIVIDRFDRIWVANNDGLRVFLPDGTKMVYTEENSGLPDDYITALAEDRQGNIWIGTRAKGIVVFDQNGEWRRYQVNEPQNGLIDNWITAILIDDQDRVWVGTDRRGISMLSPDGNWTTYDVYRQGIQSDPEYNDKEINAFVMDKQGRLWIGTSDALFAIESNGNWIAYTQANSGLSPDYVKALTIDGRGRLWIATFHELIVLDLRNELPETVSNEWIHLRNIMLIPMGVIKFIGWVLFAPAETFNTFSMEMCSIIYLALLALIFPALIGMRQGFKKANHNLYNVSLWISVVAILGVALLWILVFLIGLLAMD